MSLKEVVVEVPTCEKLLQPAPVQRSTKYLLMVPPVSVEAVQERLICTGLAVVAVSPVGAVSVGTVVAAVAVEEYGPRLFKVSLARTRYV